MEIVQTVKKLDLKPVATVYLAMTFILLVGLLITGFDHHYPVQAFAAVNHPGYESSPAVFQVSISPAQAFAQSWSVLRVLGIILWLGVGVYMVLIANELIGNKEGTFGFWVSNHVNFVLGLLMLLSITCIFVSHSSKFTSVSSSRLLDEQHYNLVKDNQDSLHKLFEVK